VDDKKISLFIGTQAASGTRAGGIKIVESKPSIDSGMVERKKFLFGKPSA
jgi:hypothetical protein